MRVEKVEIKRKAVDMPDIDTDFEPFGRDLVKDYMKQKYGYAYSCSIATFTRMKLKTCLKDFAKVKGLPFDLMNKLTKDIDDQIDYTWQDLLKYASQSKQLFKFVQENPDLVHLTKYALQQCKAASVHPSAVVIVPKKDKDGNPIDIFGWMPIKKIDGLLVSEWEGKYTEASLFLKEDILGLSQLTKFHIILDLIKKNQGKDIDVNSIPFDDEEVYRYFQKGWCEDVFQFGTASLMNYCRQLKPTQLSDLIAATALFRPGPIASGSHLEFVEIKHGKRKPKYDYGVKNITEETYSLLVYQEQMMAYIRQLGGMSFVDAENVRGYIKKKKHKELAAMGERFIQGAIKNGCPEDEAKRIWDKMNAFSKYSFNKCIAGSERIQRVGHHKNGYRPTIGEMWKIRNQPGYAELFHREHLRAKYKRHGYGMCWSHDGLARCKRNKIVDIRFEGVRSVYKVTTANGNSIRVTMNHKFPTLKGEKMLAELKVGDKIFICLGQQTITPGAKWNYGVGNYTNLPQGGQCGFQRKEFSVSRFFDEYCQKNIETQKVCEVCGKLHKRMEAHHIDGNHENNNINNLTWLCVSCHKKAHYRDLNRKKMGEKGLLCRPDKIISIEYDGEEEVYDVEVSGAVSHTFLTEGNVVTCNSHAVAYTAMSYWSQWFKVNYPLEFWTASLQEAKETEIPYRLAEMKKTGVEVEIRPPDINYSTDKFTCDPENDRIFFNLNKIKGVGDVAVDAILKTREEGGEFFSLEEFLTRVPSKVNKSVVKWLIIAGAFDLLEGIKTPLERKKLLEWYLIEKKGDKELPAEYRTAEARFSNSFWIFEQKRLTGYGDVDYEGMIKDKVDNKRVLRDYVTALEFVNTKDGETVTIAGKFLYYVERNCKNGKMCQIQIDSNNDIINCTLWPDVYEKIGEEQMIAYKNKVIAITGVVKRDRFKNMKMLYSDNFTKIYELG